MAKASHWIPIFKEFAHDLRINSKEESSEDDRGVPLVLWDSQTRFLEEVGSGLDVGIRTFFCLKSRQLGITTVSLSIDLMWCAIHKNLTMALVCENERNRDKNRATLRRYIKSFPDGYFGEDFKIIKGGDNRNFMAFSNGSRIDFLVAGTKGTSTAWGEGEGYAAAHLTEVANYGSADGLQSFEEAFAQSNPNRLFIYESTAKGFNHWRSKWKSAEEDQLTKKAYFLGWWSGNHNVIPRSDPRFLLYGNYAPSGDERERVAAVAALYNHKITPEQLAWIRWKNADAAADSEMLLQNQPWTADDAFVQSGYSFFHTRTISGDMKRIADDQTGLYEFQGYRYDMGNDFFSLKMLVAESVEETELRVWEEPVAGAQYVIGADPAYGRNDHKDRHGLSVWRCFADRIVQVAEFATADIEVKHFAWIIAHIAGAYRDCIINLEIGGPGRMVLLEWDHVMQLMQPQADIFRPQVETRHDWEDAYAQARWYLYHRPDSMGSGYASGFETTWRTKAEIMHQMRGAYVTRELDLRSWKLLEEMRIVVQDGAEIGAPESSSEDCKDDRVFACALATRAWINWRRPTLIAQGQTYDVVMAEESGEATATSRSINGIIWRWLKTKEEQELYALPPVTWRSQRGLE